MKVPHFLAGVKYYLTSLCKEAVYINWLLALEKNVDIGSCFLLFLQENLVL